MLEEVVVEVSLEPVADDLFGVLGLGEEVRQGTCRRMKRRFASTSRCAQCERAKLVGGAAAAAAAAATNL